MFFLPYELEEKIIFEDEAGNRDGLIVNEYEIKPNQYPSIECFLKSESFKVVSRYHSFDGETCDLSFSSALSGIAPYFAVTSIDCDI